MVGGCRTSESNAPSHVRAAAASLTRRRPSLSPVTPGLLDILDRVGVVAMDETRELHSDPISVMNYGAMVKRDRNHPSVVIWSFCNEGGCGEDGAQNFSAVSKAYDPTRPTLGNRAGSGTSGMDAFTDVEGFSHKAAEVFDEFNAKEPNRPKFASECCSCSSTRTPQQVDALSSTVGVSEGGNLSKVNGLSCTAEQSNRSNSRPFISGTMVWTLFDCESSVCFCRGLLRSLTRPPFVRRLRREPRLAAGLLGVRPVRSGRLSEEYGSLVPDLVAVGSADERRQPPVGLRSFAHVLPVH